MSAAKAKLERVEHLKGRRDEVLKRSPQGCALPLWEAPGQRDSGCVPGSYQHLLTRVMRKRTLRLKPD